MDFLNVYIPVYVDMGEDYISQGRSEFDCYNPHLYFCFCAKLKKSKILARN